MSKEHSTYSIEGVKEQVINTTLVVAAIVGSLAYTASLISKIANHNFTASFFIETFVVASLLFVTIRRKHIGNSIKVSTMISLLLFLSLSDVFLFGIISSTRVYLVLVPFLAIIYFSFLKTILISGFAIIVFIGLGYCHHLGLLELPPGYEPSTYVLKIYPWIINAIHISAVGLVVLYVTSKFFGRFSELLNDLQLRNIKISENERNYREIFNSTNEAIFIHNASNGKIYDVNDVMLKLYGFKSKDDALSISVKDISARDDMETQERAQELIRKAVEEGPQVFQWESRRTNGELFYSEISLKSTEIGGEGRVLAVLRDITERKKMEQKIHESEVRYRTLVETSHDGISLMDMTGVMLYVNNKKAEMVGADDAIGLIGQNAFNLLTEESLVKINLLMPKLVEDGFMDNIETEVKRFDGSTFQAEFNVTILKDSSGQPKYMMDTMRDITERKMNERALKESEEKYRTLVENVNEVIMMVDNDDRVLYVNSKFTEKLGFTADEIIGKIGYRVLINPKYQELIIAQNKTRTEGKTSQYEVTFTSKSGEEIDFLVSGAPIKDSFGRTIGSIGAMMDITERNKTAKELENYKNHLEFLVKERTEELEATNEELYATNDELYSQREELQSTLDRLQRAQNQLVQSEKMASLGLLAAGVAHEINNPLNFIHGGISALKNYFNEREQGNAEEVAHLLEIVDTGVKRAAGIVSSLSHYSRRNDSKSLSCDIHLIIENCLLMINNQIKNRIRIEKRFTSKPINAICNEGNIHQAILNILTNAIQAIDDKGSITIETDFQGSKIVISITDSGCGIPEENILKITDPFFTTKDPGKGTGLGLSITQNIVEEHNGTLEFISDIGKGTKVNIFLPLKKR